MDAKDPSKYSAPLQALVDVIKSGTLMTLPGCRYSPCRTPLQRCPHFSPLVLYTVSHAICSTVFSHTCLRKLQAFYQGNGTFIEYFKTSFADEALVDPFESFVYDDATFYTSVE
jgi:hypothetical protein